MTLFNKTIIAATVSFITASGAAFAAGHELNSDTARLDFSLDTDNDSNVSNDEIIDGNVAFFDTNKNGVIDADERGRADQRLSSGGVLQMEDAAAQAAPSSSIELNVTTARLDMSLDMDNDNNVSDDEIIDGNVAFFDLNADGKIDARERGEAEQSVMAGGVIPMPQTLDPMDPTMSFDAVAARADMSLDLDNNNEVSNDEIIRGNAAVFDTDGSGVIEADEYGAAEAMLENS